MDPTNQKNIVGLDFGTTNTCLAVKEGDSLHPIYVEGGKRTMPSVITIKPDGSPEIGRQAESRIGQTNTIYDIKRMIGCTFSALETRNLIQHWPFHVAPGPNDKPVICVDINGRQQKYSADGLATMLMHEFLKTAQEYFKSKGSPEPVEVSSIISVPAYFTEAQRRATRQAAENAGFKVITLINEPTAAALAYEHINPLPDGTKILVYDFGGGTFDVTIMTKVKDSYIILASNGSLFLGGADVTNCLVNHFAQLFLQKTGQNLFQNVSQANRLHKQCEYAKRMLANSDEVTVDMEYFEDRDIDTTITYTQFENIISEIVNGTIDIIKETLNDAHLLSKDIDKVILIGGSSRLRPVAEAVNKFFNRSAEDDICLRNINPEEAVAIGNLYRAYTSLTVRDIISHSLGVKTAEGDKRNIMSFLIKKNAALPASVSRKYSNRGNNADHVTIAIYEGEDQSVMNNILLGSIRLDTPKLPAGQVVIDVTFTVSPEGILSVTAVETINNKTENLDIVLRY